MKVLPGYAVLDCGAAKSLSGAKPVALMAQTCAREGKRVGDERDTEAIDESYHFRGIGNQIVSSFMKLRVLESIDGKEVSFAPSVTPGDIPPLVGNDHFRFDTLIPNINTQTFRPKVISHVTNGTIFFTCSKSVISAPLAAQRIPA